MFTLLSFDNTFAVKGGAYAGEFVEGQFQEDVE